MIFTSTTIAIEQDRKIGRRLLWYEKSRQLVLIKTVRKKREKKKGYVQPFLIVGCNSTCNSLIDFLLVPERHVVPISTRHLGHERGGELVCSVRLSLDDLCNRSPSTVAYNQSFRPDPRFACFPDLVQQTFCVDGDSCFLQFICRGSL